MTGAPTDVVIATDPVPASRWLRLANYLIDQVAIVLLMFVVCIVIFIVWGEAGLNRFEQFPPFLSGVLFMLVYYLGTETFTCLTLGKLVTGTIVVNERGERPTKAQLLGRTFARFIPLEPLSVLDSDRIGWHDSMPGTYVVKRHKNANQSLKRDAP